MKKKTWVLLLTLAMMLSLLPASALADGPNYTTITNYEELKAIENETGVFYFIPAEDFGWPEEATEVSITAELRMIGTWVIPEQATVNLSGKIQPDRGTAYACLTVNGTLSLVNGMSLSVSRIEIAGTLIADYGVSIYADEGELLSTGTIRAVSTTNSYRLSFSRGPGYLYHPSTMEYPAHWVFHEGAQFFGRETGSAAGELIFTGLLETVGAVRCPFMLTQYTETENVLRGDWTLGGIKVQGNAQLLIDGNVSTRYLNLWAQSENTCARVTVPEGSTFALEQWADQPNYGASSDSTGTTEILVNGTMHLGEQTMNNGALKITGTGLLNCRAKYTNGAQQPRIEVDGTRITMDDVLHDRAAYADVIAESITIEKNWTTTPTFTVQPESVTANAGEAVVFSAAAKFAETYQWYYDNGTESRRCTDEMGTGAQTDTFRLIASSAYDGFQFYCQARSAENGARSSSKAILTVLGSALEIIAQPEDYAGAVGGTATFSVSAEGENLTYQWQYSDDNGGSWTNSKSTVNTATCSITAARDGRLYRCVVSDGASSVTSDPAKLIVKPAITTQPQDYTGTVGNTASFTVKATGANQTYQWQYSDNNGGTWTDSAANTSAVATCKITAARDGRQYRCVVTGNGMTVTSEAAKLIVKPAITAQPKDYTGAVGETATFTVKASGANLSYQWQYKDVGGTWKNSTATSAAATCKLTAARDGRLYRCKVTGNGMTVISKAAKITVEDSFAITAQPQDYTGAVGGVATFTVKATGTGLTYKWQYSDNNGGKWTDSASNTSATATCKITAARDGRLYRCIVTDANGNSLTTNTAKLIVR